MDHKGSETIDLMAYIHVCVNLNLFITWMFYSIIWHFLHCSLCQPLDPRGFRGDDGWTTDDGIKMMTQLVWSFMAFVLFCFVIRMKLISKIKWILSNDHVFKRVDIHQGKWFLLRKVRINIWKYSIWTVVCIRIWK